jgi:hypothetical protein
MVDWTEEKLAALSDQQVKNLRENAERKGVTDLLEKCTAELSRRNALKPRKEGKPRSELKEFEHQMSEQLAAVGKRVADKYDLSEATAKAKSEGVKGFKAHKLLDSKGYAKLGGHQRNGTVAVDRYISYRLGNNIVSLGVWLPKDQPAEAHEFHVSAPASAIEQGRAFAEVRPGIEETELQSGHAIRSFKDIDSAAAAFDSALAKITA